MRRRDFLSKTGKLGAAAGASALASPALASGTLNLKLVGAFPRGFPGVGTSAERLAKRIEALSDGKLTINYYGGGELVPPFEVFSAVSSGVADIGHNAPYYQVGVVRSTMYFTAIPYGLDATEQAGWIYYGDGQKLWNEAYAPHGVLPFYAGNSGAQAGGWFKKPITSIDDLIGLKMRIAGLGGDILRKLGVATVVTPPAEIYPALQSGAVDAAEFVGPWNDLALGLYRAAPNYYAPAFHEPGGGLEMIVNQNRFETLSPFLQNVLKSAAQAEAEAITSEFRYYNTRAMKTLRDKGITVSAFPKDVVEAIGQATKEVLQEYPGEPALNQKIHASYMEFLKECTSYAPKFEGQLYKDREIVWANS
ncbi:TRAP transporter substrate-binding protein [Flexibacterium corallicola]|uniref:TRAP transporter substrate-binding protein n=1 Tax=Flexibacterium corallicola TaxID=3037259 RepID=UPI00286F939E|nr:TRAP transporter substrate-binding protein [Pseudovibrio sp. M1P-2-3]